MTGNGETLLSIVVPLYNEARHLGTTLPELLRHAQALPVACEFILVDDGSSDATWDAITSHCASDTRLKGLRLSRNFGKEAAISAGLRHARGDAVAVMDGDLQHPPELLAQMLDVWRQGTSDVVEAVKVRRGDSSLLRSLGGRTFNALYSRMTGYDLGQATDYKLMDRRVVDEFLRLGETRVFYRGMIAWLGFRHAAIPFDVPAGARGGSAWSRRGLVKYGLTALTSFTSAPLHIVTMLGLLTLVLSILLAVWTIILWASGNAITGFSTVIVVQLFGNSIIMLSLGVIGEYLGSVYQESKRRPRYVISETTEAADTR